ncbi:MAG: hypothetical protein QM733_08530 [Ilumatobacteraceae bacterium]
MSSDPPSAASDVDEAEHPTEIPCPNCGTTWKGNDLRPHAAWFCAKCQYPLFWARPQPRPVMATIDDSLARLPGTVGRTSLTPVECPRCHEHNPPANCVRCGASLIQEPLPPPPPIVQQIVVAQPVVVPPPPRVWPWIVSTGVLALVAIILLVLLLLVD